MNSINQTNKNDPKETRRNNNIKIKIIEIKILIE
jgi:hypothetical protein